MGTGFLITVDQFLEQARELEKSMEG